MDTPYFLISLDTLNENIRAFQDALNAVWPGSILSYSVKTNALPWLLKYLKSRGVWAEAVSDEEYRLSLLCGYQGNIIFNGPIKGQKTFARALQSDAIVNIDSENDLLFLEELHPKTATVGLRVNVDPDMFAPEDIAYHEDGFRFGFSVENGAFRSALERVTRSVEQPKIGLHLHCNTITRSIAAYKAIARFAARIARTHAFSPSFIDMGGGFFGGVEGKPTPLDYVTAIRGELETTVDIRSTRLIVEPGSAIIGSAADLVTSVVDVKDTDRARIVTTDGSRVHIDPLWAKTRYLYSIQSDSQKTIDKQIICGYTCMDHDRIMTLSDERALQKGDRLVYHRVGAYSMTFGGMFIRCLPDVYVREHGRIEKVRSRIDMDTFYDINS